MAFSRLGSRIKWLAAVVLVVGAFVLGLMLPSLYLGPISVGLGPAGPAVPREAFARTWMSRPVAFLGLGDSITEGYGASPGHGYLDRLAVNPPDEFEDMQGLCLNAVLPSLTAVNASVSGSTSLDCLERQLPLLEPFGPEVFGVVAITTGGNDLIHMYGRTPPREGAMYGATLDQAQPWIANFEKRLDAIVRGVTDLFPGGCVVFLANIYDPTDGVGDASLAGLPRWDDRVALLAAYNDAIAACAGGHDAVHLVDIHGAFLGHGIYCRAPWREHYDREDPHYWYFSNFEDPNDRGYDAIRRLFLLEMAGVLGGTPAASPRSGNAQVPEDGQQPEAGSLTPAGT